MRRVLVICSVAALGLAACTNAQTAGTTAKVNTSLATAQADVAKVVQYYGVAKGLALTAEAAEPSLKPTIDQAIAILDPAVATLQAAASIAGADATSIEAQIATVNDQVTSLELTAAPAVKVVAGS